jgi:uncharacterized protein (TIRG00374 family)
MLERKVGFVLNNNEKKPKKNLLSALILLVLIIITNSYLLKDSSIVGIYHVIVGSKKIYILIILLLMFAYISLEGLTEYFILRGLGSYPSLLTCVQIAFVGYYFSMITPSSSGGQISQAYYYNKKGVNLAHASLALIAFTFMNQFTIILICSLNLIFQRSFLIDKASSVWVALTYGFVMGSFLLLFLILILISTSIVESIMNFIINTLSTLRLVKDPQETLTKFKEQIYSYKDGIQFLFSHPIHMLRSFGITVLQLGSYFSIPYFALRSLGITQYSFFQVVGLQSILHLSVAAIPLPGSVGANESAFYSLYSHLISNELILPVVVLCRGAGFLTYVIISGVVTIYTHLSVSGSNSP